MAAARASSRCQSLGVHRQVSWAFVSAVAFVILGLSFIFGPDSLPGVDICLFHAATGLQCPGCGMTRAFCAISHGRFALAWGLNPFAYPFYALAVLAILFPPILRRLPKKMAALSALAMAAALFGFGVYRVVAGLIYLAPDS